MNISSKYTFLYIYSEFKIKLFIMLSVECDSLALSMLGEKKKKERKKKEKVIFWLREVFFFFFFLSFSISHSCTILFCLFLSLCFTWCALKVQEAHWHLEHLLNAYRCQGCSLRMGALCWCWKVKVIQAPCLFYCFSLLTESAYKCKWEFWGLKEWITFTMFDYWVTYLIQY